MTRRSPTDRRALPSDRNHPILRAGKHGIYR